MGLCVKIKRTGLVGVFVRGFPIGVNICNLQTTAVSIG